MTRTPGELGLIAARFRLGPLLGTGGSASVFEALDASTGERVALKLLHPQLSERAEARAAFVEAATHVRELRHPNLAGVVGAGVDDTSGSPVAWIALELAEGVSLAELVAEHGPPTVAEAVAIGIGIARALEAAHAAGIVHRDVSPANVMVEAGADGTITTAGVCLLDFGLADVAGRAALGRDVVRSTIGEGAVGILGNPSYASPEQLLGRAVDERGDLYQAGAVLSFALTGRAPFTRATREATVRAHLEAPPPVPSVVAPAIPRSLDRIVVRAMLKDPADRQQSAGELRTELERVAASLRSDRGEVPAERTRVLGATAVPERPMAAVAPAPAVRPAIRSTAAPSGRVAAWLVAVVAVVGVATAIAAAAPGARRDPPSTVPSAAAPALEPSPMPDDHADDPAPEPVEVVVPPLTSRSLAEVRAALAAAGLAEGALTVVESEQPGDTVLASAPVAGERVPEGAAVALTVASGSNRVPEVTGGSVARARDALAGAGFAVAVEGPADGVVTGSQPEARSVVRLGATVVVRVRPTAVPSPTPSVPPTTPAPSPSPSPDPPTAPPTAPPRAADARPAGSRLVAALDMAEPAFLVVPVTARSPSASTLTGAPDPASGATPLRRTMRTSMAHTSHPNGAR